MSKFHVNEKGEPGKCSAQNGGCPFGGESDHHASPEDARKAFEQANAEATFPVKKERKIGELSQLAKTSNNVEILTEAVERGSDRTLRNIAINPSAPAEILAKAFDRSEDSATKLKLQSNAKFPVEKMDKYGLIALRHDRTGRLLKLMSSDDVTDAQAEIIADHLPMYIEPIVNNPRNKVSPKVLTRLAENDSYSLMAAIDRNPKYPVADRIHSYSPEQLRIAVSVARDPEVLTKIMRAPMDPDLREQFLQTAIANRDMPRGSLHKMAMEAKSGYTQLEIYRHKNTDSATKAELVRANTAIADLNHVENLVSANPEKFKELDATSRTENTHGGRARSIQFDPQKVRDLGLSPADMHVYVSSIKGNRLNHAKYHEQTGEFVGWID